MMGIESLIMNSHLQMTSEILASSLKKNVFRSSYVHRKYYAVSNNIRDVCQYTNWMQMYVLYINMYELYVNSL